MMPRPKVTADYEIVDILPPGKEVISEAAEESPARTELYMEEQADMAKTEQANATVTKKESTNLTDTGAGMMDALKENVAHIGGKMGSAVEKAEERLGEAADAIFEEGESVLDSEVSPDRQRLATIQLTKVDGMEDESPDVVEVQVGAGAQQ